MAQLLFFDAVHQYELDGVPIPSVSELVAPLGADMDDDLLDSPQMANATERGTVMHAYIAHRLSGGEPDDFELPRDYEPYADAVELFVDEHRPEPFAIEAPASAEFEGLAYAGTPDLVTVDGAIYDWKFVAQISKPKVGAQLNGYRSIWEASGFPIGKLAAIQFLPDGTYRYYPVELRDDGFAACVRLYKEKTRIQPRGAIA